MAKKPHNPETYTPSAADFNEATVLVIAAGAEAKAKAKSDEPLTEEEAVLVADLAMRLRPFDLVSFALKTLNQTPGAARYPGV